MTATIPERKPKLDTDTIRGLARAYVADGVGGLLMRDTIPAMCQEIDALRAEVDRRDRLACFRIRLPRRRK